MKNTQIKGDYHIATAVVTNIESIHIDPVHNARNMALGTELLFNITYQDTWARSFPSSFEYGINVGLEVSNSRVVQASLENKNSTLKIRSQYVGDTIVKVFLLNKPEIKDIFLVEVSSVMKPVSPLVLHIGGEAQFETTHNSPAGTSGTWSAENPSIMQVDDRGKVKALQ